MKLSKTLVAFGLHVLGSANPRFGTLADWTPVRSNCAFRFENYMGKCDEEFDVDDVTGLCGRTIDDPCYASARNLVQFGAQCEKCYEIQYEMAGSSSADCVGSSCPSYTSSVFIEVVDGHTLELGDTNVVQNGWKLLCPFVCQGADEVCVETAASCASGVLADSSHVNPYRPDLTETKPGSCSIQKPKDMQIREVPCEDDSTRAMPEYSMTSGDYTTVDVGCHMSFPDDVTKCRETMDEDDVRDGCGSIWDPCEASLLNLELGATQCGECYEITFVNTPSLSADCTNGVCASYTRSIVVEVDEGHTDATVGKYGPLQNGWVQLCPFMCKGEDNVCVQYADQCAQGVVEGAYVDNPNLPLQKEYQPGSCSAAATRSMRVRRVGCLDEDDPLPGQTPPPGETVPITVGCDFHFPGDAVACDHDRLDVDDVRDVCGSYDEPCYATTGTIPNSRCGECYLVEFANSAEANADCKDGQCGAYFRSVVVEIEDSHDAGDAGMGVMQNGWTQICPLVCVGDTKRCVLSAAECANGVLEYSSVANPHSSGAFESKPGSCVDGSYKQATARRVACDDEWWGTAPPPSWSSTSSSTISGSSTTSTGPVWVAMDVGCHYIYPGEAQACDTDDVWEEDELNEDCGTYDDECPASLSFSLPNAFCGQCYELEYTVPADTSTDCQGGTCPGYTRTIVVEVDDRHEQAPAFGPAQNGWKKLCPFVCAGSGSKCVANAADCANGVVNGQSLQNPYKPGTTVWQEGSCTPDAARSMNIRLVNCDGSDGGSAALGVPVLTGFVMLAAVW